MKRMITVMMTNNKALDMKGNTAVRQYLNDNGFKFTGSCNCGGMHTVKMEYDTTAGKIKLRVRASHFLLAKPGNTFTKYPIAEIKTIIDEVKRNFEPFTPAS